MKKKFFFVIFILMMIVAFAACSNSGFNEISEDDYGSIGEGEDRVPQIIFNPNNRKIIYTVNVTLVTEDYDNTVKSISNLVTADKEAGNWIASDNESRYGDGNIYRTMTVRIKTDAVNDFLAKLPNFGDVIDYDMRSTDVTDNYAKLQAEISAKEDALNYYEDLRADIALEELSDADKFNLHKDITETILKLNSELNLLRDEITKYDSEIEYSTITLTIRHFDDNRGKQGFGKRLKEALKGTLDFFLEAMKWILIIIIYVLPFAVVGGIITVAVIFIRKKVKARKKGKAEMERIKKDMENKSLQ
jgi:hypothetical protein